MLWLNYAPPSRLLIPRPYGLWRRIPSPSAFGSCDWSHDLFCSVSSFFLTVTRHPV
jgi:hypothetical protein